MTERPSEIPYLRFGETKPPLMGHAVEIVGNARGLLQLRRQIDRALAGDEGAHSLDESLYRDNLEEEFGVFVRRVRSREEMEPRPPRPEKAPERTPWAEAARRQETGRRGDDHDPAREEDHNAGEHLRGALRDG